MMKAIASNRGYEALREWSKRLAERVESLASLESAEKAKFMARLQKISVTLEERIARANDECDRAMAKILDAAVKTGEVNKAELAAGAHALRVVPIVIPENMTRDRIREIVIHAFEVRAGEFVFRVGANKKERVYNGLLFLGAALRAKNYAYATAALWDTVPTIETMSIDDLRLRIDDALRSYGTQDAVYEMKELAEHVHGSAAAMEGGVTNPALAVADGGAAIEIPEHFEKAIVKPGDDVVQTLRRIIEDNPKRYGYHGADDELSIDLFARRLAQDAAQKDGLLRMWFTDAAAGKLAVIPVEKSDGYHLLFLDAKTQEEMSAKTLKTYTKTKPRA